MAIELKSTAAVPEPATPARAPFTLTRARVTVADRIFLTEQLQLLLETGVNLHAALSALGGEAENPALRELLTDLCNEVASGRPFSDALAKHPEVFPETYVSMVAAAEKGGFLHQVLGQLQEMEEKREELRNALIGALTYPAFLGVFSVAVVVFILVMVFPKFGKMFVAIQDQLPPTTKALMWVSDNLQNHWVAILAGLAIVIFLLRRLLSGAAAQRRIDLIKLQTPGVRNIFMPVYLIQILRTLGTSLVNGVALVDALQGCRGVADNHHVRSFLLRTEAQVREGSTFARAFGEGRFLPPLVTSMITTGDETGNLGQVMIRIAVYYEREVARRLDKFSKIAEPLMLLVMGVIVGVLVSSLILPIFKLTRAVN